MDWVSAVGAMSPAVSPVAGDAGPYGGDQVGEDSYFPKEARSGSVHEQETDVEGRRTSNVLPPLLVDSDQEENSPDTAVAQSTPAGEHAMFTMASIDDAPNDGAQPAGKLKKDGPHLNPTAAYSLPGSAAHSPMASPLAHDMKFMRSQSRTHSRAHSRTHSVAASFADGQLKTPVVPEPLQTASHSASSMNLPLRTCDLVIIVDGSKENSEDTIFEVLRRLRAVGLSFRVVPWIKKKKSVAIFVYCPPQTLAREGYIQQIRDWLNETLASCSDPPVSPVNEEEIQYIVSTITPAERLRLIYNLVVMPTYAGGAGVTQIDTLVEITDAVGGSCIETIFAPHDVEADNTWMNKWNHKWLVTESDIDELQRHSGEKVAFYFAFLRFYTLSLAPLALLGTISYFYFSEYSAIYSFAIIIWSAFFLAAWDHKVKIYSAKWGTMNAYGTEDINSSFVPEKIIVDNHTGERIPYYAKWKRWLNYFLVTFPILVLMGIISLILTFIVSLSEIVFQRLYRGPFHEYLFYVPTILYAALIPQLSTVYTKLTRYLNTKENYSKQSFNDDAFSIKLFGFSCIIVYISLFSEAWLFTPLSDVIENILASSTGFKFADHFSGPEALSQRVSYLVVTEQITGAFSEAFVPYLIGKYTAYTMRRKMDAKLSHEGSIKEAFGAAEDLVGNSLRTIAKAARTTVNKRKRKNKTLQQQQQGTGEQSFAGSTTSSEENGAHVGDRSMKSDMTASFTSSMIAESETSTTDLSILTEIDDLLKEKQDPNGAVSTGYAVDNTHSIDDLSGLSLPREDKQFMERIRVEHVCEQYDVFEDYAEMAIQYGYIVLFSPAWPLAPLACLINNFFEQRTDAFKICNTARRPIPVRSQGIGSWRGILVVTSWLGAITGTSLVRLYSQWETDEKASIQTFRRFPSIVLAVIVMEHLFFVIRYVAELFISSLWSNAAVTQRAMEDLDAQKEANDRGQQLEEQEQEQQKRNEIDSHVSSNPSKATSPSMGKTPSIASFVGSPIGTGSARRSTASGARSSIGTNKPQGKFSLSSLQADMKRTEFEHRAVFLRNIGLDPARGWVMDSQLATEPEEDADLNSARRTIDNYFEEYKKEQLAASKRKTSRWSKIASLYKSKSLVKAKDE